MQIAEVAESSSALDIEESSMLKHGSRSITHSSSASVQELGVQRI
jgi:hypothetical protein